MPGTEVTLTLPPELAAAITDAVRQGAYVSSAEVVHEALQSWAARRVAGLDERQSLRADLDRGE